MSGRGTPGYGTVLPALCEWRRKGLPIGEIFVAATRASSVREAETRLATLNKSMRTDLHLRIFPEEGGGSRKLSPVH